VTDAASRLTRRVVQQELEYALRKDGEGRREGVDGNVEEEDRYQEAVTAAVKVLFALADNYTVGTFTI
jgi:hypothetical protein